MDLCRRFAFILAALGISCCATTTRTQSSGSESVYEVSPQLDVASVGEEVSAFAPSSTLPEPVPPVRTSSRVLSNVPAEPIRFVRSEPIEFLDFVALPLPQIGLIPLVIETPDSISLQQIHVEIEYPDLFVALPEPVPPGGAGPHGFVAIFESAHGETAPTKRVRDAEAIDPGPVGVEAASTEAGSPESLIINPQLPGGDAREPDNSDASGTLPEGTLPEGTLPEGTLPEGTTSTPVNATNDETGMGPIALAAESDSLSIDRPDRTIVEPTGREPVFRELPVTAIRLSRTGITLPITLDGFGWIFMPEVAASGYEYVGRELTDEGSLFNFRVDERGDHTLRFQRQDHENGSFVTATVRLLGADAIVSSGSPLSPALDRQAGGIGEVDSEEMVIAGLVNDGNFSEATEIAFAAGDQERVASLISLEFAAADPLDRYSRIERLLEASRSAGSADPVASVLDALISESKYREDLETLADFFDDFGADSELVAVLEALLGRYEGASNNDLVHLRIARIFERDGGERDERRAHDHYRLLVESFPLSLHYEEAERRMLYIERHYLNIR